MMTPVSGTMSCEPKSKLMVVVKEMAIPEASAVTICDVLPLLLNIGEQMSRWTGNELTVLVITAPMDRIRRH